MKNIFKINLETLIWDIGFLILGYSSLYFCNRLDLNELRPLPMVRAIAAMIIIIHISHISNKGNRSIYENKRTIIPFIIGETILIIVELLPLKSFIGENLNRNCLILLEILLELGLSSTIFICYFFKIKLKNFNWNISIKSFILVIILYIVYKLIWNYNLIYGGNISVNNILSIKFISRFGISAIRESLYPGFYEEVLYRGFLISGLKGIGLSDDKCNIVQAIIFGVSHAIRGGTTSWIILLSTGSQAMMGYILGKIYFKTKSLTPCILFHGLLDTLNF